MTRFLSLLALFVVVGVASAQSQAPNAQSDSRLRTIAVPVVIVSPYSKVPIVFYGYLFEGSDKSVLSNTYFYQWSSGTSITGTLEIATPGKAPEPSPYLIGITDEQIFVTLRFYEGIRVHANYCESVSVIIRDLWALRAIVAAKESGPKAEAQKRELERVLATVNADWEFMQKTEDFHWARASSLRGFINPEEWLNEKWAIHKREAQSLREIIEAAAKNGWQLPEKKK